MLKATGGYSKAELFSFLNCILLKSTLLLHRNSSEKSVQIIWASSETNLTDLQ